MTGGGQNGFEIFEFSADFPVLLRRSFDILSALLRSGVGLRSRAGEPSEMMLIFLAGNLRWSSGDESVNPRWP